MSMTVIFVYETKSTSVHSQFHPINHWNNVMYYMCLGARYNIPSVISLNVSCSNIWRLQWEGVNGELLSIRQDQKQSYAIICEYFLGDVVSDTFNNVSWDKDNIWDQIYIKQICPGFYYDDFWFSLLFTKMHTNHWIITKT